MNILNLACFLHRFPLALVEQIQTDHNEREEEIPVNDNLCVAGREVVMLKHVKDVSLSSAPAEDEFHDNEGKPVGSIPETKEANNTDADGGESQYNMNDICYCYDLSVWAIFANKFKSPYPLRTR